MIELKPFLEPLNSDSDDSSDLITLTEKTELESFLDRLSNRLEGSLFRFVKLVFFLLIFLIVSAIFGFWSSSLYDVVVSVIKSNPEIYFYGSIALTSFMLMGAFIFALSTMSGVDRIRFVSDVPALLKQLISDRFRLTQRLTKTTPQQPVRLKLDWVEHQRPDWFEELLAPVLNRDDVHVKLYHRKEHLTYLEDVLDLPSDDREPSQSSFNENSIRLQPWENFFSGIIQLAAFEDPSDDQDRTLLPEGLARELFSIYSNVKAGELEFPLQDNDRLFDLGVYRFQHDYKSLLAVPNEEGNEVESRSSNCFELNGSPPQNREILRHEFLSETNVDFDELIAKLRNDLYSLYGLLKFIVDAFDDDRSVKHLRTNSTFAQTTFSNILSEIVRICQANGSYSFFSSTWNEMNVLSDGETNEVDIHDEEEGLTGKAVLFKSLSAEQLSQIAQMLWESGDEGDYRNSEEILNRIEVNRPAYSRVMLGRLYERRGGDQETYRKALDYFDEAKTLCEKKLGKTETASLELDTLNQSRRYYLEIYQQAYLKKAFTIYVSKNSELFYEGHEALKMGEHILRELPDEEIEPNHWWFLENYNGLYFEWMAYLLERNKLSWQNFLNRDVRHFKKLLSELKEHAVLTGKSLENQQSNEFLDTLSNFVQESTSTSSSDLFNNQNPENFKQMLFESLEVITQSDLLEIAIHHHKRALKIPGVDLKWSSGSEVNLGVAYRMLGRFEEDSQQALDNLTNALQHFKKAYRIKQKISDDEFTVAIYNKSLAHLLIALNPDGPERESFSDSLKTALHYFSITSASNKRLLHTGIILCTSLIFLQSYSEDGEFLPDNVSRPDVNKALEDVKHYLENTSGLDESVREVQQVAARGLSKIEEESAEIFDGKVRQIIERFNDRIRGT